MRATRCLALFVVLAAFASAVGSAEAAKPKLTTLIAETAVQTWRCQDQLGVARTQIRYSPWSRHSRAFRTYQLNLWKIRRDACLATLHQRGQVWRRLQRGLAGSPMAGSEKELEAAARRHHVSPFFIAAIAATESSLGAAGCGSYNYWGLANCTGIWGVPAFRSLAEAYEFMARFLSERWPHARTTYDYHGYAACSSCWGAKTESHMRRLFGVGSSVSY